MNSKLFNSVLPTKVYGIWNGYQRLGEVTADNVHEALRSGRDMFGAEARVAILEGTTQGPERLRWEPMFI